MLWRGRRESSNVDDRRGMGGGTVLAGGGILGVIILLANMFLGGGGDINDLQQALPQQQGRELSAEEQALENDRASFVKVVLADTEDVWDSVYAASGQSYQKPTLVLFRGSTQSGCGFASAATGPFYCPADNDVYIDLSFAEELKNRFGASGDFALAYVVAHEVGHHIQYLNGTSQKMDRLRQQLDERSYNKYSVMLELQADFLAGFWAHHNQRMKNVISREDIADALEAANAIGDDRLQQESQGRVMPDAFTHGTSEQRMYWFKRGFESGDLSNGDTFQGAL